MALDFSLLSMIVFKKTTTVSEENKVASLSFNDCGIEKKGLADSLLCRIHSITL